MMEYTFSRLQKYIWPKERIESSNKRKWTFKEINDQGESCLGEPDVVPVIKIQITAEREQGLCIK